MHSVTNKRKVHTLSCEVLAFYSEPSCVGWPTFFETEQGFPSEMRKKTHGVVGFFSILKRGFMKE